MTLEYERHTVLLGDEQVVWDGPLAVWKHMSRPYLDIGTQCGARPNRRGATVCYMRTVTHREMRNSSGEILRAVAAGETVQVTNNGRVAAVIWPPSSGSLERLVAQGLARPARRSVAELSTIRRRTAKQTSAELIRNARGPW